MHKIVKGVVQKGKGYAGTLGFPTVNIPLADDISGIFAARVTVKEGEAPYMAAVFADPKRKILEAHILDFEDDLVGQEIGIELFEKIRETEKFESEDDLRAAIAEDIKKVRRKL
ncbi:FMN adenylyltransferase [Candidatus Parcubacteria bacterium]|nr:MAG: FMN adenylyltransferase [Candidatus Parcubacteria bacterium]